MKTRTITAILLLLTTIISIMSIGYSLARGNIQINPYTTNNQIFKVVFIQVECWDNEKTKEVAQTTATITPDGRQIQTHLTNAYPCYTAYINFTIQNQGTLNAHINKVTVENPNPTALEVTAPTYLECTWIAPWEKIESQATAHLTEPEECHTYTFKITIQISGYPVGHPCTIGFWKHQFQVALGIIKGKAQVDPDTLEQLLDQTSAQSQVFEFTGTRTQKFQQALSILDAPYNANMEAKLKAQLLGLWLNYFSGWTNGYTLEGMTAYQIIQGSENALINNLTSEYEYWKDLCDDFNNLG